MTSPRRLGALLILLGLVVLAARMGASLAWPVFVLAPGVALLAVALFGPKRSAGMAVPGAIVSTVGLILLVQQATGTYQEWAYAWGLVLAAVGAGTFLQASIEANEARQQEGVRLAVLGLTLFAAFGAFFELLIFGGAFRGVLGWALPIGLIVAGALLLWRRPRGAAREDAVHEDPPR
ncbi:MAG: hypothetical protein WD336_12050 [Trueperaceae bacterium]